MKRLTGSMLVLGFGWGLCATSIAQELAETKTEGRKSAVQEHQLPAAAESTETATTKEAPSGQTAKPVVPAESTASSESKTAPQQEPGPSTRESRSQSKDVIAEFSRPVDGEAVDGEAAAAKGLSQEKRLTFNFHLAPWSIVLKRFANAADLTLDMGETETPPGTFSYLDNKKYTPAQALDLLNGYLLKRGYLLIRRDKFLVVWSVDNAIPPNLVPLVSVNDLSKRGLNEYLSILIPLGDSIDAKSAAEEVKDLLGPQGKALPMAKSNQLKVTDIGSNLRQIVEFLGNLEKQNEPKSMTLKAFKLVYISASEAERELRELFGLPAKGSQSKAAAEAATNARPQNNADRRNESRGGGRGGFGGGGFGGGFPGGGGFQHLAAERKPAVIRPRRWRRCSPRAGAEVAVGRRMQVSPRQAPLRIRFRCPRIIARIIYW